MVDAKDLKSFGLYACAGSSPALGTIYYVTYQVNKIQQFSLLFLTKRLT